MRHQRDLFRRVWQHRVPGVFSASPIAAEGRVYFVSESGRTLVWRMPQTPYPMTSSRRLRDVFLPAYVELPPTLGAGRYTLKAIVRDGADGAVDERIVPLTLLAEPAMR